MKWKTCEVVRVVSVSALIALNSSPVNALINYDTVAFSQGGFNGGGFISGTFGYVDNNNDRWVDSTANEVVFFDMSFTGDSLVGSFSHDYRDLIQLEYRIGNPFLGTIFFEGVSSHSRAEPVFDYKSGLALGSQGAGGRVIDVSTGASSSTAEQIAIIPEPGTYAMMLAGLGLLGWRVRHVRKQTQI